MSVFFAACFWEEGELAEFCFRFWDHGQEMVPWVKELGVVEENGPALKTNGVWLSFRWDFCAGNFKAGNEIPRLRQTGLGKDFGIQDTRIRSCPSK
jgi:hypothetical protein